MSLPSLEELTELLVDVQPLPDGVRDATISYIKTHTRSAYDFGDDVPVDASLYAPLELLDTLPMTGPGLEIMVQLSDVHLTNMLTPSTRYLERCAQARLLDWALQYERLHDRFQASGLGNRDREEDGGGDGHESEDESEDESETKGRAAKCIEMLLGDVVKGLGVLNDHRPNLELMAQVIHVPRLLFKHDSVGSKLSSQLSSEASETIDAFLGAKDTDPPFARWQMDEPSQELLKALRYAVTFREVKIPLRGGRAKRAKLEDQNEALRKKAVDAAVLAIKRRCNAS